MLMDGWVDIQVVLRNAHSTQNSKHEILTTITVGISFGFWQFNNLRIAMHFCILSVLNWQENFGKKIAMVVAKCNLEIYI